MWKVAMKNMTVEMTIMAHGGAGVNDRLPVEGLFS